MSETTLSAILSRRKDVLVPEWVDQQLAVGGQRAVPMKEAELREQCGEFFELLTQAIRQDARGDLTGPEYARVRDFLNQISRTRSERGFSSSETAWFILSLKKPLFSTLRSELGSDPDAVGAEVWRATELLDRLALLTTDAYQLAKEKVIERQQAEMLELSTPVVKLWDGVLALPLIGTLDSMRTQTVMEALLQRVMDTSSEVVIIDITGVPTVDTLVAQHLLKTVSAARFMGVDCIISGIRPQIAQTIVHLGVNMGDVITKATLADAFKLALAKRGLTVMGNGQPPLQPIPPAPAAPHVPVT
ncbi:MAG: STAS domain-containing protein [Gemmatimonadales bacterium]